MSPVESRGLGNGPSARFVSRAPRVRAYAVAGVLLVTGVACFHGGEVVSSPASREPPARKSTPSSAPSGQCRDEFEPVRAPGVPSIDTVLSDVTSLSATDAWAVGFVGSASAAPALAGQADDALILHWDGARWSRIDAPYNVRSDLSSRLNQIGYLTAVSGASPGDVWAVGYPGLLIEHWDSKRWSIARSADIDAVGDSGALTGVTVLAPDDVWAVGGSSQPSDPGPVALHWDGTSWRKVAMAPHDDEEGVLSVAAAGPDDIWASGAAGQLRMHAPIAEHWDGQYWIKVPLPFPSSAKWYSLLRLAASGPDDVWIVGHSKTGKNARRQPFAVHFNGERWETVSIRLSDGMVGGELEDVATRSEGDVWMVGSQLSADGISHAAVWHRVGGEWTTPALGGPLARSDLRGLAASEDGEVWLVGRLRGTGQTSRAMVGRRVCP